MPLSSVNICLHFSHGGQNLKTKNYLSVVKVSVKSGFVQSVVIDLAFTYKAILFRFSLFRKLNIFFFNMKFKRLWCTIFLLRSVMP